MCANSWFIVEIYRNVGSPLGFPEHMQKMKFKNHDQGTATHMVAAFANHLNGIPCSFLILVQLSPILTAYAENDNGKYLLDSKVASWDMVSSWARNSFDAERLWKMSEKMVGEKFDF